MTYRDDLTAAEARAHEVERRLDGARQENARLRGLVDSRPNPWKRAATVLMAVAVSMAVVGVVYLREVSRKPDVGPPLKMHGGPIPANPPPPAL